MLAAERMHLAQARRSGLGSPSFWLAVVLGFCIAVLTVAWPVAGMGMAASIGGFLILACRPQWLWFVFTAALAVPIQRSVAGIPLNAADALIVLWCLLWPLLQLRSVTPQLRTLSPPSIVKFIAPFLVAVLLSQMVSVTPASSLKQSLRVVEWFVLLPVLLMVFRPSQAYWRFASVMLLLVPCFFAIDGLVEVALKGRSLTHMMGISVPVPEGGTSQIRHTFDVSGRAGSTFGGAQGLAMYLVMSMSVVLAHVIRPPWPGMRPFAIVCALICTAGLAATYSRGGLMGALALLTVLLLVQRPRGIRFFAPVAAMVIVVLFMALALWPHWDGTIAGLVPGRPEAVLDRLIIWNVVLDVVKHHPLLGVGLGNFRDEFFARNVQLNVDLGYSSVHAHNTFLEIVADTGLVGLCAYLFFLSRVGTHLRRLWRNGNAASPVFTLAALGALGAYCVFAMVDMLLLQNMHMLLVTILTLGLTGRHAPAPGLETSGDRQTGEMP